MSDGSAGFDWTGFTHGTHFGADVDRLHLGADAVAVALAIGDLKGEAEARAALEKLGHLSGPEAVWRSVELRALAAAANGNSKWQERARLLSDGPSEGDDRISRRAEARRLLLLAEARGRELGVALEDVLRPLDEAAARFRALDDVYNEALCDLTRGRVFSWRGRIDHAAEALTAALLGFLELGNKFRISDAAYELGVAYRDLHRFDAAIRLQRRNVSLEEQRGNPESLARAEQSLAMTLTACARERPAHEAESLRHEAQQLATAAYAKSSTSRGEETATLDNELRGIAPDAFRACVAARDLAEIELQRGDADSSRAWFARALAEANLALTDGETLRGKYVARAFVASLAPNPDAAQEIADRSAKFRPLRLAEIEQQLARPSDLRDWGRGLDDIARVWELRAAPQYAVEAWLKASDLADQAAEQAPETAPAARANADYWRFMAVRRAADIGLAVREGPSAFVGPHERDLITSLGLVVEQTLLQDEQRTLFRVREVGDVSTQRLLIWRPPDKGEWSDRIAKLAGFSRRQHGVCRIAQVGETSEGRLWILDEDLHGRPLTDDIRMDQGAGALLRKGADLANTLQGLLAESLPSAHLTFNGLVAVPGDRLVLHRYGLPYLDPPGKREGLYEKGAHGAAEEPDAFFRFFRAWVNGAGQFAERRLDPAEQRLLTPVLRDLQDWLKAKSGRDALQGMATTLGSAARALKTAEADD